MSPTEFTPVAGLIGGALIGLSAVTLMAGVGRIAGASNIFASLLTLKFNADARRNLIFIAGLVIGAAWSGLLFTDPSALSFTGGPALTLIGGLLVGIGVTLGNGCTSCHGICGLSRFSRRSLAATCVFMAVAIATVITVRHVPFAM